MRLSKTITALIAAATLSLTGCAPSQLDIPNGVTVSAPDWMSNATVYEVNTRSFTSEGTFAAFSTHLDRLKTLGVKVLWFMPIQPISKENRKGSLGSPYSVANYTAVNSEYGTRADFKTLVEKAHEMGFKVVLDWVANHSGWDNPWVAKHPDWYSKGLDGKITNPLGTDWTDVADFNYDNVDLRNAMIDAMNYWVTHFDIDGFRMDAAGMVPNDFWDQATYNLTKIKPLWMLAETQPQEVKIGRNFTSAYNWDLKDTFNKFNGEVTTSFSMAKQIAKIQMKYPGENFPMNFITNHDENSWNGTEYERLRGVPQIKAASVIYFTLPGAPLIYNGQEVGNKKRLAFFEKDQIDWPINSPLTQFYQNLVALKTNTPALAIGKNAGKISKISGLSDEITLYARSSGSSTVLVAVNMSGHIAKVTAKWGDLAGSYTDWTTGKITQVSAAQDLTLPAWGYQVLTK